MHKKLVVRLVGYILTFSLHSPSFFQRRVEAEIQQLMADIRRIGPTYPAGSPHVLFGELFDDEDVQQYYEALVGTLKCAKKREFLLVWK